MTNPLEVTVIPGAGHAVLRTDGYINNLGGERLADACKRLIDDGTIHLILNFEHSTVVNSVGISILIEVIERIEEVSGTLAFCMLTPTIAKTFRIMRLTDATTIFGQESEAIAALAI